MEGYSKGRFVNFALLDKQAAKEKRDPAFFFQLTKYWQFSRDRGYTLETPHGAHINVTLAIHQDCLDTSQDVWFWVESGEKSFAIIDGLAGFAEPGTPWGVLSPSGLQGRLVEYRYKDMIAVDYRWGCGKQGTPLQVATTIPKVEWGLFLGPELLRRLGDIEALAQRYSLALRRFDQEHAFIALTPEPRRLLEAEVAAASRYLSAILPPSESQG